MNVTYIFLDVANIYIDVLSIDMDISFPNYDVKYVNTVVISKHFVECNFCFPFSLQIKELLEEVSRLQAMRDMRLRQIQELQATLDEKCQHIELLESRLEKQKNEQIKTDNISVSVKLESEPEKEEHNTSCPSPKHSNENSENFSLQQPYQPQHFPPQQHIFSGLHLPFQDRSPFRFSENGSLKLSTSLIPKADPMEAKLQEILRYNMDKYINQELDTKLLSLRVRELLSVHNIGQRHFAKYVLGLSQGTVSELLSKPKCWEKLTEKGRDSYRKMHAWAGDENAIQLLKTFLPKKGEFERKSEI